MTDAAPAAGRKVKLSSLKTDLSKEREGDWMPALDIDPSVQYLVRSTNYPPFRIARDAYSAKLARKYGDRVPDDELAEVYGKLAVEHLLLDWRGFVDDVGADIPFTPEKAREILTNPEYKLVRGSIYAAAMRVGTQEVEFVGEAVKN